MEGNCTVIFLVLKIRSIFSIIRLSSLMIIFLQEQGFQSDANRKKEREIIQRDVQKLSQSIQTLTRSVNPLGKFFRI